MTIYAKLLELHPEYTAMRATDLARNRLACPEDLSEELLGRDNAICEAEHRTPGICRQCQMNFLTAQAPEESENCIQLQKIGRR